MEIYLYFLTLLYRNRWSGKVPIYRDTQNAVGIDYCWNVQTKTLSHNVRLIVSYRHWWSWLRKWLYDLCAEYHWPCPVPWTWNCTRWTARSALWGWQVVSRLSSLCCDSFTLLCRISLTLSCPMNLKLYPLDRQVCSLRMASCKYTTSTS